MATILIVEDHLVTQRVLSTRLRTNGHQVITVNNGREAIAALDEAGVNLVISDIAMPEMDGLTLLRQLRADHRHCRLPVLMLTASVLDQQRQEALAAGVNGFLEKPVSSWELEEAVKRLVNGAPHPEPSKR